MYILKLAFNFVVCFFKPHFFVVFFYTNIFSPSLMSESRKLQKWALATFCKAEFILQARRVSHVCQKFCFSEPKFEIFSLRKWRTVNLKFSSILKSIFFFTNTKSFQFIQLAGIFFNFSNLRSIFAWAFVGQTKYY